jgi:hypothetical protein
VPCFTGPGSRVTAPPFALIFRARGVRNGSSAIWPKPLPSSTSGVLVARALDDRAPASGP